MSFSDLDASMPRSICELCLPALTLDLICADLSSTHIAIPKHSAVLPLMTKFARSRSTAPSLTFVSINSLPRSTTSSLRPQAMISSRRLSAAKPSLCTASVATVSAARCSKRLD